MDKETRRQDLKCKIYPLETLEPYKYVVVCSNYMRKWVLSKHKERDTWETQGGHIEQGETPLQAAQRELYEESGITDATIYPVCDYFGYNETRSSNGVVFLAVIHSFGTLPESEMEAVQAFATLPENLTYPEVTPVLIEKARESVNEFNGI